ncbi:MAG: hypothetical protein CML88_03625 [Rhodobiaceae bacterium]|nr:hypothetical protein [Rhodobiaceae bacterium]|tara:strand:+ start:589 stop:1311 length:723 start_codon:yes stop_codon:yes gene_type:complete
MQKSYLNILALSIYALLLLLLVYLFFSTFSISDIKSLEFLVIIRDAFDQNALNYYPIKALSIFLISLFWAFFLGFNAPIAIFSGMILGAYMGTFISVIGLTLGSGLLYLFAQFFFKENISSLFNKRYQSVRYLFHQNELIFFIFYRLFVGIPFGLSNLIAILFNARVINFLLGTAIGILPSVFIWASIGRGFDKILIENEGIPRFIDILNSEEVRIPLIIFVIFVLVIFISKKIINAQKN